MAYILLHSRLPGTVDDSDSVTEKQAEVQQILKNRETACIIRDLTEIGCVASRPGVQTLFFARHSPKNMPTPK